MELLNHIKQHRARLDLTQQDLADAVGVRRQTILAVEKGKYVPSALLAFRIARALGMGVEELFELATDAAAGRERGDVETPPGSAETGPIGRRPDD